MRRQSRDDSQRLAHIVHAASAIAEHLADLNRDEAPESMAIDAIKYNLVAIGEAANHVSVELRQQHPETDWKAVSGLRNVLTHEYFRVNVNLIRDIAEHHIPILLRQTEAMLSNL